MVEVNGFCAPQEEVKEYLSELVSEASVEKALIDVLLVEVLDYYSIPRRVSVIVDSVVLHRKKIHS